jgi:3-oxoacyl-[acyl-carrier protein] reductase
MNANTRTAFVTGSGRKIGRAIVLELAKRGCNVIVNGSSNREACEAVAAEAEKLGVAALVAMGNVGDPMAVTSMAKVALERFGTVDILANNAAIRPHAPFLETTDEEWQLVLDVDLTAAFRTSRAFLPGMVAQGWGRIVNFTGMNAIRGNIEGAPISVAKHGVWGLTKSLAREFGPRGITVNAISPGPIAPDDAGSAADQHSTEMIAQIPLGHRGKPSHVGALCGFLASDEGGFVTGQMIACNGGAAT